MHCCKKALLETLKILYQEHVLPFRWYSSAILAGLISCETKYFTQDLTLHQRM